MESSTGLLTTLRNRDFLALWIGQLISQIGDNFVYIAGLALITSLTDSPLTFGIVAFCTAAPQVVFGLIGGVFVDRWDRRMVMIVSDILRGIAILALLLIQRPEELWILYVVTFLASTVGAFFYPARNAVIPNIVPEESLLTANALVQGSQIVAIIVGASVAGLLVGWLGTDFAFVFDSFTFFVSAGAVATMNIPHGELPATRANLRVIWDQLIEGLSFIKNSHTLTNVIITTAIATLGFGAILVLGVVYLGTELGIGAEGLGFLYAFQGLGVVAGGLLIGQLAHRVPSHYTVSACMTMLGLATIGFALAPNYPLVLAMVAIIGLSIVAARAALATMTQALVPDEKRGRVESAVTMVIGASSTLATGLAGVLGEIIGVRAVFFMAGLIIVASGAAAIYVLREAEVARRERWYV